MVLCEKYRRAVGLTKIDLLQSLAYTRLGSDTQSETFTHRRLFCGEQYVHASKRILLLDLVEGEHLVGAVFVDQANRPDICQPHVDNAWQLVQGHRRNAMLWNNGIVMPFVLIFIILDGWLMAGWLRIAS